MEDEFKKLMEGIKGQTDNPLEMMPGSFAKKGSKPYCILGIKDGMTFGFKFISGTMPVFCGGVRIRVQWEPGHSDIDTARTKFKRQFVAGSTKSNGSYMFWLPLLRMPYHLGVMREEWVNQKAAERLAKYLLDYCESVSMKPKVTQEQIVMYLNTEFDDDFPPLSAKPIEGNKVLGLEEFMDFLQKEIKKD